MVYCSFVLCHFLLLWASLCPSLCIGLSKTSNCEALSLKSSLRRIKDCFSWPCCWRHPNITTTRGMSLSLMTYIFFFFLVIQMSIFCEILEFAGWGRSKTTWETKQQRIVTSEHWLCTWHVSDICADFIYFPWILIWRYWITRLRCMVCLYPQLPY